MSYPKAQDKKIRKLTNLLVHYAEREGLEFSFSGEEIYPVEVFSFFGGLSLFLAEAKEHYEKIYSKSYTVKELMETFGRTIPELTEEQELAEQEYLRRQPKKEFPVEFYKKDEDTYFGFIPGLPQDVPVDFALLTHLTHYSLDEYVRIYKKDKMLLVNGKIPIDPLYEKIVSKIKNRAVIIKIPQTVRPDTVKS